MSTVKDGFDAKAPKRPATTQAKQAAEIANPELLAARPWIKHYDAGVPPTLEPTEDTLLQMFDKAVSHFPDRAAIVYFNSKISYKELEQSVNRFAAGLADLGVEPGDRVALVLPNCPQFLIAFFGALKAGAIVVPCNPTYVERELEEQLSNSGAKVVVTLTMFFNKIYTIQPKTQVQRIIVGNIKDYFPPLLKLLFTLAKEKKEGHRVALKGVGVHSWLSFLKAYPPTAPQREIKADDVALFQYTGGTTGTPKGAMLTHRNLLANTMMCVAWLGERALGRDVTLCALPFFHVYGLTVGMNTGIALGSTLVLLPRVQPTELLETIHKYHPTLFPGVPAIYISLLNHPEVEKYNIGSIEICLSGAAPLPVEVQTKFEAATGARLGEGYGMTECSPVSHSTPVYGKRKEGSIGVPFPGIDAKIVDLENGDQDLPVGEIGELVVKGCTVMLGYYNREKETALTIRNGWLYTGDIAKMDEDGFFYIVDRKKDMILSNGFNVYPRDVEEVLFTHPAVKEAMVIGAPNERGDTTVKAFVVLKEGMSATENELVEFCRQHLARYKAPRLIEFRESLPKTLVGKTLRRVMVEEEMKKLEEKRKAIHDDTMAQQTS